jgi:hypothetical protein
MVEQAAKLGASQVVNHYVWRESLKARPMFTPQEKASHPFEHRIFLQPQIDGPVDIHHVWAGRHFRATTEVWYFHECPVLVTTFPPTAARVCLLHERGSRHALSGCASQGQTA